MASTWAFKSTKWTLDIATKLIKADIRLHNAEAIRDDMAIIFTVNHFTRLETLLLPYQIHKATGKEVWSLADASLFVGRIGSYLSSMGTVSTKDPDRDRIIVRSLLSGDHPWIIFPEGQMVKDKKVIDPGGTFRVFSRGIRRPPHTGAASIALRAEYYRHKLGCLANAPHREGIERVLERFALGSFEQALSKRTVIIPVNVTYFPIRAQDNPLVRLAKGIAKGLSARGLEELSVEGTILSQSTDIDISLGEPIDILRYLEAPEYAEMMACGEDDMKALEEDPRSPFNEAARKLMLHYMSEIYRLTTINYDHLFATLIRHQRAKRFTERAYRNRIFLCAQQLKILGLPRIHSLLERTYRDIIYEDYSQKFHDFMGLCIKEGTIRKEGDSYIKVFGIERGKSDFHAIRMQELAEVIANEIEPLPRLVGTIKEMARLPRKELSKRIRTIFLEEDARIFREDYARNKTEEALPEEVCRPFLLAPARPKAGIVLVHGYLSVPGEIRAMAEHFFRKGYAVYGVRLKGHGTSPADLAATKWEEWYESLNRGYTIVKSLTDRIILGGFSTGGGLSLLAAGRKGTKVEAVFAINTPLQLRNTAAWFAPSLASMNALLDKVRRGGFGWEFVPNYPENKQFNYTRNPVSGVAELDKAMGAMERALRDITVPTLVLQGSRDPLVEPASGQLIFDQVGTAHKELIVLERSNHGIVNNSGAEDVFNRIHHFLEWAGKVRTSVK
jgi:esterase/lipase/1-acyl-sn-glycerol-3-phosphate acyltransferase